MLPKKTIHLLFGVSRNAHERGENIEGVYPSSSSSSPRCRETAAAVRSELRIIIRQGNLYASGIEWQLNWIVIVLDSCIVIAKDLYFSKKQTKRKMRK